MVDFVWRRRPPPADRCADEDADDFSAKVDPRYDRWRENVLFPATFDRLDVDQQVGRFLGDDGGTSGAGVDLRLGFGVNHQQDQEQDGGADNKTTSFAALMKHKNGMNDLSDIPDDFTLPAGSLKKGQKYFKKYCRQCHSIYSDNRPDLQGPCKAIGPTMFEVCGRASGMEGGAVWELGENRRAKDLLWTDAALMNYMKNPRLTAGGPTQMSFPGIRSMQVRVDIVHYLHTLNAEQSPELVNFSFK
mmetsp:Transcript_22684/g.57469  ORF Transcript_22684/g.57469 Transcript_22684/m.57469 type:complete len:246 (-) Transcript_22684:878-1615(-)|eukprot:g5884.t1